MKLNKTQLQKMIKEAIEVAINAPDGNEDHLDPKFQKSDTYKGDTSLRGGVRVTTRQPSVGDTVVFSTIDYFKDERKYHYGKVVSIENKRGDRANWNTRGEDPYVTVEVYFESGQKKKGSKTGEQAPVKRLEAPQLYDMMSGDIGVLADQGWLEKQS